MYTQCTYIAEIILYKCTDGVSLKGKEAKKHSLVGCEGWRQERYSEKYGGEVHVKELEELCSTTHSY